MSAAEAYPCYEEVPKIVDEESGVLYSSAVQLWPDVTEETDSLYHGNIYLDSVHAKSAVTYKLRVASKSKHKGMFHCSQSRGVLQPNGFHKIGVHVKEEAISSSRLHLHLNEQRLVLKMEKSPAGEHFYREVKPEVGEEQPKEETEKLSRWQMTDQSLAKIMPMIVQHYIKEEQRYNLRRAVFSTVYPLILEMMSHMGRREPCPSAVRDAFYFDGLEEMTDPIDRILEYVVMKLEEDAEKEPAAAPVDEA